MNTPKIEIHKISEYDKDGPFLAWNWLKIGEHSGTHFDAPHHWITGKDYPDGYTDTIPMQRLIAPVNVIDCSAEVAKDPDFLLTADGVKAWEAEHGEIKSGEWVVMRSDWYKRNDDEAKFLNADENRSAFAGTRLSIASSISCRKARSAGATSASAPMPARPAA